MKLSKFRNRTRRWLVNEFVGELSTNHRRIVEELVIESLINLSTKRRLNCRRIRWRIVDEYVKVFVEQSVYKSSMNLSINRRPTCQSIVDELVDWNSMNLLANGGRYVDKAVDDQSTNSTDDCLSAEYMTNFLAKLSTNRQRICQRNCRLIVDEFVD